MGGGGAIFHTQQARQLGEMLDSCGMVDFGFSGPKFTWSNSRKVQGPGEN